MPSKLICSCCNKSAEQQYILTCSICKKLFKNTCVNISNSEVRIINPDKGYDWSCTSCRTLKSDLNELKALIIDLQQEIRSLKSHPERPNDSFDFEEILVELDDRNNRKSNIVIFGVPESVSGPDAVNRVEVDKRKVFDILSVVDPDFEMGEIKPIRLGKFSNERLRPIKITLNSENDVRRIIRNGNKLRSHSQYEKVFVSFDRTPRQLRHYRQLKDELEALRKDGKTNFKIRYVKGVQKIVEDLN